VGNRDDRWQTNGEGYHKRNIPFKANLDQCERPNDF